MSNLEDKSENNKNVKNILGISSQNKWKHKKRGTIYTEVARGIFQCTGSLLDEESVVIYQGEDGKFWVRPVAEFEDGRFERIE
jgi:hypothetical protein